MSDATRRQMLHEPRRAFAFQGRDKEVRSDDRASLKQLRERAAIAIDMPRGQQRDLEITRVYRALCERQAFDDMAHAGTREHHVIQWVFRDAYTKPRISRNVPAHERTKFTREY